MSTEPTIIEVLHDRLATCARAFYNAGRWESDAHRDAGMRDRFRADFPNASRIAEENFMTRLYRAEAAEAARMEARRAAA